jgi:hypothetical protein
MRHTAALRSTIAAAALAVSTGVSSAAVIYQDLTPTATFASPGTLLTPSFVSAAGAGNITFQLRGERTLDGLGGVFSDGFALLLDFNPLFAGSFNLGGGGSNVVAFNPNGATWTAVSNGFGLGGTLDVTIPVFFTAGGHTIRFNYGGIPQGLADEGWGVNRITVEGPVAALVPEPSTWGMMLIGFAGLALTARRKARAQAA